MVASRAVINGQLADHAARAVLDGMLDLVVVGAVHVEV